MAFHNLLSRTYIESFRLRQSGPVESVPTPFPSWNHVSLGDGGGEGLAKGWLIVVGGNPKQGKTLLALNLADAAIRAGETAALASLEMADPELAARAYAMIGRVPAMDLQKGRRFKSETLDHVVEQIGKSYDGEGPALYVNSELIFDLERVLDYMKLLRFGRRQTRWFLLDYLQLVSMGDDEEAVRVVTRAIKEFRRFAKETGSCVIVLSQYKRSVSEDYTQTPMPQGLFGGGAVEQCADQIALLDHSLYEYDAQRKVSRTWLRLTQRHGPSVDIPILWNWDNLSVREGMPDEEKYWPTRSKRTSR